MQLSGISIYPVKSCAGINLDRVTLIALVPSATVAGWLLTSADASSASENKPIWRGSGGARGGGIRLSLDDSSIQAAIPGSDAPELRVSIWGFRGRPAGRYPRRGVVER